MTQALRATICVAPADAGAWHQLGLQDELNSKTPELRLNAALRRASAIQPDAGGVKAGRPRTSIRSSRPTAWPSKSARFEDLRRLVDDYIFRPEPAPEWSLSPSTRLFTFGSCFATNLSRALLSRGYQSYHLSFNEEINSTFANRHLLDWLVGGTSLQAQEMGEFFGEDVRQGARDALAGCEAAVMTLGVAPCFFTEAGEFVFAKGEAEETRAAFRFRMTTVAENVANLRSVLKSLQAIRPGLRVIFTVSPIPLSGVVGLGSAVLADCLSKSTLRSAVAEVVADGEAQYFPAFEIVKWLGSHAERAFFGTEDGDSRYVSGDIIDLVVDSFVRRFMRLESRVD